jgi:hypothetical protein
MKMIRIPKFQWIDGRTERYEAIAEDGARLVVVQDRRWDSWFWRVEREGGAVVAGFAPDLHEAQERAIGAWIATR